MRVLLIGYSGSGKTTAGNLIAKYERRSVSTSDVLLDYYCRANGLEHGDVLQNKSTHRDGLWRMGRTLQASDPLALVNDALFLANNGDGITVVTGVRNQDEMLAIRQKGLFDLIIWIARDGCGPGNTDKLSPKDADWVVYNDSSQEQLELQLQALLQLYQSHEPA